jgi:hypothetical protein
MKLMSVTITLLKPNGKTFKDEKDVFDWELQNLSKNRVLNYSYMRSLSGRSWHRVEKRLSDFPWANVPNCKHLPCDVKCYAQGWFLRKSFFNKKNTLCICTSKKQMQSIMKKYFDFRDTNAIETYHRFMNAWEDGMIFELSF